MNMRACVCVWRTNVLMVELEVGNVVDDYTDNKECQLLHMIHVGGK